MIRKTTDMRNRAVRSPVVMGIAGAILGTVAARMLRNAGEHSRRERIEWEPAPERHGLVDKVRDAASDLKEKAFDLKDRAADKADDLKDRAADLKDRAFEMKDRAIERLPSGEQIKDSVGSAYRWTTEEQPLVGGLLALGVGMALGILLPVSEREERVLEDLKHKAASNLDQVEDKVRELADKAQDKLGSSGSSSTSKWPMS